MAFFDCFLTLNLNYTNAEEVKNVQIHLIGNGIATRLHKPIPEESSNIRHSCLSDADCEQKSQISLPPTILKHPRFTFCNYK